MVELATVENQTEPGVECSHRKGPFSLWFGIPRRFRVCLRCGALKIGPNSAILAANHLELDTASAPANPAAGKVRLYAVSDSSTRMRDSGGSETDLAAGSSAHAAAQHNAATLPSGFNENLGAAYIDAGEIAAPANPAANIRRIFVDSLDGKLKIRTPGGSSVSLEEQGGGATFGVPTGDIDIGDAAAEGASANSTRADHQHAFPAPAAAYPLDVAAVEGDGVATTPARADHVHAHGSGYSSDAHHLEAHSIASHSTKDHSELDGVDPDDHHPQGHTFASHTGDVVAVADGGTALGTQPNIEASISAASLKGTGTNGAGDADKLPESRELATNLINIDYLAFDQSDEQNAFFVYSLPTGWNEGTITFRVKWTSASGSGTFVAGLKALAVSNDGAMDAAWGAEITVTDTLLAADDCHISPESTALTIGGTPAEGDLILFNLARKTGSDTLTADAQLLEIILTFTRASYTD